MVRAHSGMITSSLVVVLLSGLVALFLSTGLFAVLANPASQTVGEWNAQLAIQGDLVEGSTRTPLQGGPDLDFGIHPDATNEGEGQDEPFLESPGQELLFFFRYTGNLPAFRELTKSKIENASLMEWPMRISVELGDEVFGDTDAEITITPSLTEVPSGASVLLLDSTGASIIANLRDGPVNITLLVPDGDDRVREDYIIRVAEAAAETTAVIDAGATGFEGASIPFSAENSGLGEGATNFTNYVWDFGDGSPQVSGSDQENVIHNFPDDGTYTVTLTVTDDQAGTDNTTHNIDIVNVAPTVEAGGNLNGFEGGSVALNGAFFTDPGFDCPNCSPPSQETFNFFLDWGDGTAPDEGSANATSGSPDVATLGTLTGAHTYGDNGTYTLQLCVEDDNLGEGCDTAQVTIANVPPVVDMGPDPQPFDEGAPFFPNVLAAFADPGFGCANCNTPTQETFTFTVDWGDGTTTGPLPVAPQDVTIGSPGIDTVGEIINSHRYGDNGTFQVEVCVTDDDSGEGCDNIDVTVANVAPEVEVIEVPDDVDEGSAFFLPETTFTDPGFGCDTCVTPTQESFTFQIDWGDGKTTGPTPVDAQDVTIGLPGVLTQGDVFRLPQVR